MRMQERFAYGLSLIALLAIIAVDSVHAQETAAEAVDETVDESIPTPPAEPTGWTPELALEVKRISNVRVSPSGRQASFEVATPNMEDEKSEWITHIHITDAEADATFQLTRGDKSCSGARWSPDGEWIAFTSSRGGEKTNIFRIRVKGGEAEKLTDVKGGISSFKFSPDGSHIAFTMTDAKTDEEEAEEKEKRDARVVDEDFKMSRLHIFPVEPNETDERPTRLLTEGDYSIGGGFFGSAFDFSPDGTAIVFAHTPTPKVDDWTKSDVSIVEVSSAVVRPLATTDAAESGPVFSPDGQAIAMTVSDTPPSWAFAAHVHVVDRDGANQRALAKTFDESPGILGWHGDGNSIIVSESHHTRTRVYALPTTGEEPFVMGAEVDGYLGGVTLDRAGRILGFTMESANSPPEAFVSNVDVFVPTQISEVQELPEIEIGHTEVIQWRSTDGMEVEGLLTYPVGYEAGQPVPLLLVIHGGPAGVFAERFIGSRGAYPIAAFAERGYAVLRCNPRGSSGYGKDFRFGNYEDWGGGDYQDIMTGVDHVIDMGVADADRLGVMGWSYGGYMTSWVITQTDRFKAASVGAGVTNLMSFTGTADIPSFVPDYFRAEYWDDLDTYREHSAMFNVKNAATPTLIQHGENDARVPISQGYELYNALKRQGVVTKMIVYPRQPHGVREPKLLLQAMHHNLDWFDEMIMGESQEED